MCQSLEEGLTHLSHKLDFGRPFGFHGGLENMNPRKAPRIEKKKSEEQGFEEVSSGRKSLVHRSRGRCHLVDSVLTLGFQSLHYTLLLAGGQWRPC